MADDRSETSRPSWRRAARPTARPDKASHGWTQRGAKPEVQIRLPRSWAYKVTSAALGFVTCLALVVLLIWALRPPQPVAVVLVGADYANNLAVPHNVLGWQGLKGIEGVLKTPRRSAWFNRAALKLVRGPKLLEQKGEWEDLIKDLKKTGFDQDTILIVLALHGGSDSHGAYLMPNQMAGPEDQLPLADVIKSMGTLPPEKRKILILEGAQISADWRQGMLYNDFARRLKELEPKIRDVKNLWVLSGCDVDQRCWDSEGLGRTVFSHYLIEALRGKAAGSDGRLTLDEFYKYIRSNVAKWAWDARGAVQEPVLLPGREERTAEGPKSPSPRDVSLASIVGAADPGPAPAFARADPTAAWTRFQQLNRLVPHPAVYAPWRWREYLAMLVRYEELVRAGAVKQTTDLAERLRASESELRRERFLKKLSNSVENTLAMHAVQGDMLGSTKSTQDFVPFWNAANRAGAAKEWEKLQSGTTAVVDAAGGSLRSRVSDFLLQRAATSPGKDLSRAADRLDVIRGTDYPLPAEAHLLRMLNQYSGSENGRPVSQALTIRRKAERAALGLSDQSREYHYCEQVHTWIRPLLETADEQRRLGEDRLFSSEGDAWNQSRLDLSGAERMYQEALQGAGKVRAALAVRDRVLARLPDYSRWLAHRHSDELEDDLPKNVEDLWSKAHELTETLETSQDVALGKLDQLADRLGKGFDEVAGQFDKQKARLTGARFKEDWVVDTASAAVAFDDTDDLALRTVIWDRLDNIRRNDFEMYAKGENSNASADERKYARQRHQRRARVQGRMAMAVLGPRWFNDVAAFPDQDQGDFKKNSERVLRAIPEDETEIPDWSKDLVKAGELVGQRWRQLSLEIHKLASEKNGIPDDLHVLQSKLLKADRLARQIDGGAPSLTESEIEATARYRQTRVHDLLLWMAERTWRDHWYAEEPRSQQPYYQSTGARFVKDAAQLFPQSAGVRNTQERLAKPGQLELKGPPPLVLTSERSLEVSMRVVKSGTVPDGIPVLRPRPSPPLQLDEDGTGYRTAPPTNSEETIRFLLSQPLAPQAEFDPKLIKPRVDQAPLIVEGLFRGQPFNVTTDIELHPLPEVVAIGPAPPDPSLASIAVRTDQSVLNRFGEGTGAIAIILDCSGSMGVRVDKFEQFLRAESKFKDAKRALGTVFSFIPDGTTVSLWTFGQARTGLLDVMQANAIDNEQAKDPALTIQRLRGPTVWKPAQREALMNQLEHLWPFHGTPLVKAMDRAMDDLSRARNLKTLLVLTDGNDLEFERDEKDSNIRKDKIQAHLRKQFDKTGIAINMVFFRVDPKELAIAIENFKVIQGLDPPGQYYRAENLDALQEALKRSIRQKLACEIIKQTRGNRRDGEPLAVTVPGQADHWSTDGLDPGRYTLQVRADRAYRQDIELAPGDRMIIRLVEGPDGGIAFERALYSDDVPSAVHEDRARSRMSVLSDICPDEQAKGLQMLLGLESLDNRGPRLRQVKPRMSWFELMPKDARGEPDFALRWRERGQYPAPVWQFDVPQWVADPGGLGKAPPVVKAWWSPGDPDPAARLDLAPFTTPEAVNQHEIRLADGKSVIVESIRLEDHLVDHQPGEDPASEHCLVVRLDYRKEGSPVLIDPEGLRPDGIELGGYEHRLYTRAGKYAGLFWPVTRDQIKRLKSLSLISVAQFRTEAAKQQHTIEIDKLPRPQVGGKLPKPPVAIILGN